MTRYAPATLLSLVLMTGVVLGGGSGVALASWHGKHQAKELQALDAAKTSAARAVAIAQNQTGGRAMRVTFDHERGGYLYRIKTLDAGGKVMWVLIDPMTGKIARMYPEGIINRLADREDRLAFAKLSPSATSLDAAIVAVRKDNGGRVLKAAFLDEEGRQTYAIRVAKGDQISRLWINPATGVVTKKGGE